MGLLWGCSMSKVDLTNFKVLSNLNDSLCSDSTWSISSDAVCVCHKKAVSPPYCLTVSRSCWFTVLPREPCCESHLFSSPAGKGTVRVFFAWKCVLQSAEWGFVWLWSHTECQEAWGREAGRAHFRVAKQLTLKGQNNPWQLVSCLLSLKVSCTESQSSVLLAVLFPGEIPKKDQPLGNAAVEGPFLGHLAAQDEVGEWCLGLQPPESFWGIFFRQLQWCVFEGWGVKGGRKLDLLSSWALCSK